MRTLVAILLLLCPALLKAEAVTAPLPTDSSKAAVQDTILYIPNIDTTRQMSVTDTVDMEKHLIQNPTTALFKSLLVPGWGQYGNKRYLKAAIFAGLEIWFVGEAIHYAGQASDLKKQWEAATTPADRNYFHGLYKDRYTRRSKFIWYAGITTFVSIFDAYVDAHLSGEQVQQKKSGTRLSFSPSTQAGPGLTLSLSF
jgi:hypothetical protein